MIRINVTFYGTIDESSMAFLQTWRSEDEERIYRLTKNSRLN
jgi:hypothetical protein